MTKENIMKKQEKIEEDKEVLTYAVTLYFDDETSGKLRGLTKELSEVTGNNYMIQNNVPPHLTLGMFHVHKTDVEKLKNLFGDFVESVQTKILCGNNFEISLGAFDSFVSKVIFIKIEKDKLLSEINRLLHKIFVPHFEAGDNRNYLPENWYPHITLGCKLTSEQFEKGMSFLKESGLPNARCTRIGLACCNPYTPELTI